MGDLNLTQAAWDISLNKGGRGPQAWAKEGFTLAGLCRPALKHLKLPFPSGGTEILKHPFPPSKSQCWIFFLSLYAVSFCLYGKNRVVKLASFLAHLSLHFRAGLCQDHGQRGNGHGLKSKGGVQASLRTWGLCGMRGVF